MTQRGLYGCTCPPSARGRRGLLAPAWASVACLALAGAGTAAMSQTPGLRAAGTSNAMPGASAPLSTIPLRRGDDTSEVRWMGNAVVFLALLGVGGWALVRFRRQQGAGAVGSTWPNIAFSLAASGSALVVEERHRLAGGCMLYVVRWDQRRLLLGASAQGVTVLSESPISPPAGAAGAPIPPPSAPSA